MHKLSKAHVAAVMFLLGVLAGAVTTGVMFHFRLVEPLQTELDATKNERDHYKDFKDSQDRHYENVYGRGR